MIRYRVGILFWGLVLLLLGLCVLLPAMAADECVYRLGLQAAKDC